MITADNITDEQIRELRDEQLRDGHQLNAEICDTALGHLRGVRGQVVSFIGAEIEDARARCAEILNAQSAKQQGEGSAEPDSLLTLPTLSHNKTPTQVVKGAS